MTSCLVIEHVAVPRYAAGMPFMCWCSFSGQQRVTATMCPPARRADLLIKSALVLRNAAAVHVVRADRSCDGRCVSGLSLSLFMCLMTGSGDRSLAVNEGQQ